MERAIYIEKRGITDLGDLLNVARSVAKQVLNVDRVHISPEIAYINNGYTLIVSPSEKNGKEEKSDVERKHTENPKKP